ncbi:DUF4998 domain-containing protein [Lunatibacter salilacus]|uniref:DUF4998 domain-containing protein n=1 Tax=Lunatibacter salilacus TaxID=2483804 RepID=UPI00131DECD4|nr:DUF4998 domain-containing protein [Lunatibacter salilacus]
MKSDRNNSKKLLWFALLITGFSCSSDLRDTYKEFIVDAGKIYIGAPDSVFVEQGFNKLKFNVAINADPKISKGVLSNLEGTVDHEFDVARTRSGNDTIHFELALEEGEYTFQMVLMDNKGNTSVKREFPARVLGENYRNSLLSRSIGPLVEVEDGILINWTPATSNMAYSEIQYLDEFGLETIMEIANNQSSTLIDNYLLGSTLEIRSYYFPILGKMEVFQSNTSELNLPLDRIVPKSPMSFLRLPGDASDGCWGSEYSKLLDGTTSTGFWHSCSEPNDLYPWVMSIDLGAAIETTRFKIDQRPECCGERGPRHFQIWATNELGSSPTGNLSELGLEVWENDAESKGWVKLLDVQDNTDHSPTVNIPSNGRTYKFIRIVGISSISGETEANFNEFTFWGK